VQKHKEVVRQASIVHITEKGKHGLDNKFIHHGYRKDFNSIGHTL